MVLGHWPLHYDNATRRMRLELFGLGMFPFFRDAYILTFASGCVFLGYSSYIAHCFGKEGPTTLALMWTGTEGLSREEENWAMEGTPFFIFIFYSTIIHFKCPSLDYGYVFSRNFNLHHVLFHSSNLKSTIFFELPDAFISTWTLGWIHVRHHRLSIFYYANVYPRLIYLWMDNGLGIKLG